MSTCGMLMELMRIRNPNDKSFAEFLPDNTSTKGKKSRMTCTDLISFIPLDSDSKMMYDSID